MKKTEDMKICKYDPNFREIAVLEYNLYLNKDSPHLLKQP